MKMNDSLSAQLVDPADATLSAGSNKKVRWRCPQDARHVWEASPNQRRRSPRCPVCLNRVVLPGVNDLASTHPGLAAQLVDPSTAATTHAGSHDRRAWRCAQDPAHVWEAEVVSRSRLGSGCPFCSGRQVVTGAADLATTHPGLAAELVDPAQAASVGAGSAKKLAWRCRTDPSHVWEASVRNRAQKHTGCPVCTNRTNRRSRRNQTLGELDHPVLADAVEPDLVASLSTGSGKVVAWTCTTCPQEHVYTMPVRRRLRGQGCSVAAGTQVLPGVNDLATTHPGLAAQLVDPSLAKGLSRGSVSQQAWRCGAGHEWTTPVYARVAGNGCPSCSGHGTSGAEAELAQVLRGLCPGETVSTGVRGLLEGNPRAELDVVVPSRRLAVEFDGVYWHSEAVGKAPGAHRDKSRMVAELGWHLVHVWEDDWRERREQVVRALAHKAGALDRLPVVLPGLDPKAATRAPARTLRPAPVDGTTAGAFLRANHLQGAVGATRHFALLDADDDVRALLSLRSPRAGSRVRRGPGCWEVVRYATCGLVPGGFTKLLAHATRELLDEGVGLTAWVSFSSDDVSDGGMYAAAGFEAEEHLAPDYRYAGVRTGWRRVPKEGFQRKRFRDDPSLAWDESWTEHQAALANGLYRVYDAGKTRWVKHV